VVDGLYGDFNTRDKNGFRADRSSENRTVRHSVLALHGPQLLEANASQRITSFGSFGMKPELWVRSREQHEN
jgi:hypothetical protein